VYLFPGHGHQVSEADRHAERVEVPRVEYEKLSDDRLGEPSAAIRGRVAAARDSLRSQLRRFEGTSLTCNADMGPAEVRDFCQVDPAGKSLLKAATPALAAQVQVCSSCR